MTEAKLFKWQLNASVIIVLKFFEFWQRGLWSFLNLTAKERCDMANFKRAKWEDPEIEFWDDDFDDDDNDGDNDDDDDDEWRPEDRQLIIGVGGGFFGCYPRRFCFPRQVGCRPFIFGCFPFGCRPRFYGCHPRQSCRPRPCYPI